MSNELKKIFAGATAALAVGGTANAQSSGMYDVNSVLGKGTVTVTLNPNGSPNMAYSGPVLGQGQVATGEVPGGIITIAGGCGNNPCETFTPVADHTKPGSTSTSDSSSKSNSDSSSSSKSTSGPATTTSGPATTTSGPATTTSGPATTNSGDINNKSSASTGPVTTTANNGGNSLSQGGNNSSYSSKYNEVILPNATNVAPIAPGAAGTGPGGCSDTHVEDKGGNSVTVYVVGFSHKQKTVSDTHPNLECNSMIIAGQARLATIQKEIANYQADTQFDIATLPDCDGKWITFSKRAPAAVATLIKKVNPNGDLADLIAAKCEVKVVAVAAPAPKPPLRAPRRPAHKPVAAICPTEDKVVKMCQAPNGQVKPLQLNH